jgi:O-antigen/teichoic acid export membrane protein
MSSTRARLVREYPLSMSVQADTAALTRTFRRGFATTFAVDLLTKALAATTVIVLIRGLSVSSYAYVTLFLTIASFAGSAAGGGVRTRYLREEAERVSRGTASSTHDAFIVSLCKGTLLIASIGVLAFPVVRFAGLGSEFAGPTALVAFATAFAAGFAAAELGIARYQARKRFVAAGAIGVARAAALLAASAMIVVTRDDVTATSLWLVASMVIVGLVVAWMGARGPGLRTLLQARPSLNSEEAWLSVYYVGAAGFAYVDVMVAGALLTGDQVATLGASLRYLALIQTPIAALGAILRVRTSQFDLVDHAVNQRAMMLRWLRRTALPTALLVGLALALAPALIPQVDGGKYPGSIIVLQIFLITAFTAYTTAPAASILMAQRRYPFLASVYLAGLLLNLVGDIAVAPRFGVVGIAVVSSVIYVAIDMTLTASALRHARRAAR